MHEAHLMDNVKWLLVSALVIILDQLSKQYVVYSLLQGQPMPIFPWLNLTLSHNTGVAFSMMAHAGGWKRWLLSAIAFIVSALLVFWIIQAETDKKLYLFALSLILGGAVSNLIDRLLQGYVIDFIDFHINFWHFAVFNLADSAITVGAVLLGFLLIFKRV